VDGCAFRTWIESLADAEATIPARVVLERLPNDPRADRIPSVIPPEPVATWRERLWLVASETRLGAHEVAEALGRSRSWIYKRTARGAEGRIPCRRLDGELVFLAGELRAWIREREESVHEGPSDRPTLRAAS
jgi:predicted DNA-binding transcriptional regulator AlpA